MKYTSIFIFIFFIIISTGCGTEEIIEVKYNIEKVPGGNFQVTVNNYFRNFDDIRSWRKYSTDSYVKTVYSWCTGDSTEEKTIDEMVEIYYELNKDSLKLKSIEINEIDINEENKEVIISVTRKWENDEKDETSYLILLENREWKIDNRF